MNVFAEWKNENKSTRRKHIVKNVCQQIANERERKKRMKEKKKRMENDEKKPQPTVKNTTQRDQKKKFSFSSNKREEEKKIPRTKLFHKIMYEVRSFFSFLLFLFISMTFVLLWKTEEILSQETLPTSVKSMKNDNPRIYARSHTFKSAYSSLFEFYSRSRCKENRHKMWRKLTFIETILVDFE